MFSIYFGSDSVSNGAEAQKVDRAMFDKLFRYMLAHGVYLPPSALEVEFMSAMHREKEIKTITEVFDGFFAGGCT